MGRLLRPSIAALAGVLLLAACAGKWTKPGATDADFQAINHACTARAIALYPPRISQALADNQPVVRPPTTCKMNSNDMMGPNNMMQQTCDPDPGDFVLPSTVMTDSNAGARNGVIRNCLIAMGWQFSQSN